MSSRTEQLVLTLLRTIEKSIFPLTSSKETDSLAAKIFGAAILSGPSMRLITVAGNKDETSPIHHGEIVCIHEFFTQRSSDMAAPPDPQDCILLSSHEPCSMCLSAIAWSGFKQVYYLFSYEETRDVFGVPEDIDILDELFGKKASPSNANTSVKALYNHDNNYFKSSSLVDLAAAADGEVTGNLIAEVDRVKDLYIALTEPDGQKT